ncbi:MAG TPA: STAS domain-containing protein [Candidatus Polarisedimenticolia bacterium]|nr:STAS domain-containing protein [Candidatus Polarisedimenticolia bacterium]
MAMTIEAEDVAGARPVAVLTLAGELDASNYERLIEAAQAAYGRGARGLVLDMTGLTFMASSGLVALYSAVRIMRGDAPPDPESGWGALHELANEESTARNVRLAGVQPAVERVLERTGLRRLFEIDASSTEATAALQGA